MIVPEMQRLYTIQRDTRYWFNWEIFIEWFHTRSWGTRTLDQRHLSLLTIMVWWGDRHQSDLATLIELWKVQEERNRGQKTCVRGNLIKISLQGTIKPCIWTMGRRYLYVGLSRKLKKSLYKWWVVSHGK